MLFGALFGVETKNFPLLVKQLYSVGVQSLAILVFGSVYYGMVLSLQGYVVLIDYGAIKR